MVAEKHEVITAKMEKVGEYNERLKSLVGEEEAAKITIEAMNSACEKKPKAEQQSEKAMS